jgi:predicted nucleic-acid-binding protein
MKTYFIDTNAILRFLLKDVEEQAKKTKFLFQKAEKNEIKIFIIAEVIAEIIYILTKYYALPKNECVYIVKELLQNNYINIANLEKQTLFDAVNIFEESGLDFVDSLLIVHAKNNNSELFTFDKKMKRAF